jgi:predicted nucleic acid-binding protein
LRPVKDAVYLDASALVKLVISEAESNALREFLGEEKEIFSSRIAAVEVRRAVARQTERDAAQQLEMVLSAVQFVELGDTMALAAAATPPPSLRSLDAIHLAAAMSISESLRAVIAYDTRLAAAARSAGLEVRAPGL